MEYRVELDVFNGPMDLLLFLIKRDELDIYDIPIARITESYLSYVHNIGDLTREHGLDITIAGDFMVTAATLMEIKSAMLLPRTEAAATESANSAAAELADPRLELVRQLLEYKRFKDQATLLDRHRRSFEDRFPRIPVLPEIDTNEPPPLDMDEVQVWDLLDAFSRLMKEIGFRKPKYHEVEYDETPIELHAADIEDRLTREPRLSLRKLLEGRSSRSEMIGVFLAILELVREKKILASQGEELGDIELESAPLEHRMTFPQASIHLADAPPEADSASAEAVQPAGHDDPTSAEAPDESTDEPMGAPAR